MHSFPLWFAVTASASLLVPNFGPIPTELPQIPAIEKRADEPCAHVSQILAALSPQETARVVPAKVAYDCLMSVPVDVEGDIKQIAELKAFVQFQSNLEYLKQGIKWHNDQPVDILGGLDDIAKAIENRTYKSDYEVQRSINNLLNSAYDNHLAFVSDLHGLFQFIKFSASLVSVSKDGVELPEVYMYSDLVQSRTNPNFTMSSIKTINGEKASEYLEQLAVQSVYHDPDTRYNTVFPNMARDSLSASTGNIFRSSIQYEDEKNILIFNNGTSKTIEVHALVAGTADFTNVTDGKSLFAKFCQGPAVPEDAPTPTPTNTAPTNMTFPAPQPTDYPKPAFIHSGLAVGAYYLNGTGHDDVAVLSIPEFMPASGPGSTEDPAGEFQKLVRNFLADARIKNKKKLIVDLRGNGGGQIVLGFDVFKQLFPTLDPYSANRMRAHEAVSLFTAITADFAENETFFREEPTRYMEYAGSAALFNWSSPLTIHNTSFQSYHDYYGPHVVNGDNYSSLRRYNFYDPYGSPSPKLAVSGYGDEPIPEQPFASENIILLQDGFCGSTCAVFSELMRTQGNVQTIAIGGRPIRAPMQGIGGTKGSQTLRLGDISDYASMFADLVTETLSKEYAERINQTVVGTLANPEQLLKRSYHDKPGVQILGSINLMDHVRQNDTTETPLEFVYEAADCKLFYTMDGFIDQEVTWKQVADAKWGNGKCVEGSMGDKSALSVVKNQPFKVINKTSGPQLFQGAASETRARGLVELVTLGALVAAALTVL
ncbi:hypothetical protein GQ43DRAFT_366347 [Delitschia confertaspora ATCC 74209]|uniref:Tail specific protease domain-containing protein n=1 Tax=Delitschia confertaspora ATCC 74209 TaxID=1513339 RepID=A0A9P4JR61_9PLEO|nr:hypothetical protein GQ43DRAFT_366347 [Delitschia confertaspora ATCC 74209]